MISLSLPHSPSLSHFLSPSLCKHCLRWWIVVLSVCCCFVDLVCKQRVYAYVDFDCLLLKRSSYFILMVSFVLYDQLEIGRWTYCLIERIAITNMRERDFDKSKILPCYTHVCLCMRCGDWTFANGVRQNRCIRARRFTSFERSIMIATNKQTNWLTYWRLVVFVSAGHLNMNFAEKYTRFEMKLIVWQQCKQEF